MSVLGALQEIDVSILLRVNGAAGISWLDTFMVLLSAKWVWLPLYGFVCFQLFRRFGLDRMVWLLLVFFSLLVITDQGSVRLFKEVFERLRPCHNPSIQDAVQLVSGRCGGKYGFISSHASNVFGFATLAFLLLGNKSKLWLILFIWAGLVSLSRVYLGVHYPSDVVVGAIYGCVFGLLMYRTTKQIVRSQ